MHFFTKPLFDRLMDHSLIAFKKKTSLLPMELYRSRQDHIKHSRLTNFVTESHSSLPPSHQCSSNFVTLTWSISRNQQRKRRVANGCDRQDAESTLRQQPHSMCRSAPYSQQQRIFQQEWLQRLLLRVVEKRRIESMSGCTSILRSSRLDATTPFFHSHFSPPKWSDTTTTRNWNYACVAVISHSSCVACDHSRIQCNRSGHQFLCDSNLCFIFFGNDDNCPCCQRAASPASDASDTTIIYCWLLLTPAHSVFFDAVIGSFLLPSAFLTGFFFKKWRIKSYNNHRQHWKVPPCHQKNADDSSDFFLLFPCWHQINNSSLASFSTFLIRLCVH